MEHNRPRGRERHIEGPGKTVQKRGQGLGTGPVGDASGYSDRKQGSSSGTRSAGSRGGGGIKLITLLLVLLLGGGGGLTALLGGQGQQPSQSGGTVGGSVNWAQVLGSLNGGSVSSGWQSPANTGKLNTSQASEARDKYTRLLGDGRDTVTIMVYMCGTDLESRSGMGTADLQEMLNARFGNNLNLLVYTGGCKGWKNNAVSSSVNQIWQVKDGNLVSLKKDLGSVSMTDPNTLTEYIRWCAKNYPASRYELILWDHGGGSVSGYGYDEKFASSGSMSLAGLDTALKNAGVKFDFIGFDACLMATAETALTMAQYADYLIASEETEPGVGWYYTDWLTAFGKNTSLPTIEVGQKIVDSFVDTCAQKCRGQLTTLSVVDLAELEVTLPKVLSDFSKSTARLIQNKEYQTVSNARGGTREFAQSSRIDQVDLVHLAGNLGTPESKALSEVLLSAVKYNRTSSNMTNAYGLSIYFPYRKSSMVDQAASTYQKIGMDESYSRCIRQFASLAASGQAASGGTASPLPALMGSLGGSGGADAVSALLGEFLNGGFGRVAGLDGDNTGFLSDRAMSEEDTVQYLTEHRFPDEALVWQTGEDGARVLRLSEEQWGLVQSLELNLFYDDGEGYLDLGLDNVYQFNDEGGLLGISDGAWLAINGQPVAYYHMSTVDDGENYAITGRVPVLHNGQRSELILVFDNETPYGYVAGVQRVYLDGETDTVAKNQEGLQPGDVLEFICDYYTYDMEYQDSYLIGEPLTVTEEALAVSDVPLEGSTLASYCFTDLYNQRHWTPTL
ncbi:peptidase C11 [Colidextribacter sp. OB.20]|uniref:clostripain-related cysteine peptidase n=1 Tax=Colidextribacter sp. OB.20 TaxID=2304568 RepID=UPI00136D745C|nr:clostripain-related cysteine peptidase [Colidextribacter sp. OB.20]NBI08426.1 peptidase C11 [Colidextribacter sp. OB.20]